MIFDRSKICSQLTILDQSGLPTLDKSATSMSHSHCFTPQGSAAGDRTWSNVLLKTRMKTRSWEQQNNSDQHKSQVGRARFCCPSLVPWSTSSSNDTGSKHNLKPQTVTGTKPLQGPRLPKMINLLWVLSLRHFERERPNFHIALRKLLQMVLCWHPKNESPTISNNY